jgi:hypothetical protein
MMIVRHKYPKCYVANNFDTCINKIDKLQGRGAKSGGTGEPGSLKVNWPEESFGAKKINW